MGRFDCIYISIKLRHEAVTISNVMPFLQFLAELSFLAIISTCQSQTIQIFTQEYQNEKPN
jgi:hypothetical protein